MGYMDRTGKLQAEGAHSSSRRATKAEPCTYQEGAEGVPCYQCRTGTRLLGVKCEGGRYIGSIKFGEGSSCIVPF